MDVLTDLLRRAAGPHSGALVTKSICSSSWSLRYADDAPVAVEVLLRGSAWLTPAPSAGAAPSAPVSLAAGDVAFVRGPYTIADAPTDEPGIVVYGPGACAAAGEPRALAGDRWRQGPRSYGLQPTGTTVLVRGAYPWDGAVCSRLLDALPPVAVVPAGSGLEASVAMLAAEVDRDAPGQDVVLDRMLDLLFVLALRTWFTRSEANPPRWYAALLDPVIGPALRLLHDDPAQPWTVDRLAKRVGLSRAALARRFTALVGEPPLTYLTGWRMALAADLLHQPDATLGSVASRVGYTDALAFSTAFRRVRGVRPSTHRALAG